jgi:hypothetical protein
MKSEINLSRNYYLSTILKRPLIESEPIYWTYRHQIEIMKANKVKYNQRLLISMIGRRKNYLEGILK